MSIPISINSGKDFEPVSEGVHQAVLADIEDLGMVQTAFGDKPKVKFLWLTDEADEGGRTKYVFERFTASLHEKAQLRKRVKELLGRDLSAAELKEKTFDIETLLGTRRGLIIEHNESQGKVYANVKATIKPDTKARVEIPADFVRKQSGKAVAAAILKPASKPEARSYPARTIDDIGI